MSRRARATSEPAQPVSLARALRRPLRASIASVVVLSAAIVITASTLLVFVRPMGARYERAVFNVQDVHLAMIDQETGLRGFLLTQDTDFLQPYTAGRAELAHAIDALRTEVAGDDTLVSSLDELSAASRKWQESWAQPLLLHPPRVDDQPVVDAQLTQGKALFDSYRVAEGRTLVVLQQRRAANRRTGFWVIMGGAVLGVVASGALLFLVTRSSRAMRVRVLPPVGNIRATLTALAGGRLDARVAVRGPTEMRDIATDINRLGEVLHRTDAARAKEEAKLVRAHAARDDAIAAGDAKEEFLAMMSHEIRTPLNAVIGLTDLLLTTELDQHQRQNLAIINRSGDTLLTLVNNILDYSKIVAGDLNLERLRFDLVDVVQGVAEMLSHEAHNTHLKLRTEISPDTPRYLIGDATRIRQILLNLVSNAVKFTDRGEIVISASLRHTATIADPDPPTPVVDSNLTLTVRDTGIGIAADTAKRLFQPFTQADPSTTRTYGGTGLGLAISRRIARAMGGDITLASSLGKGSTFVLVVPVAVPSGADVAGPGPGADQESLPLRGLRMLAVDDNATNRAILTAQIERGGGTCVSVGTAAQALATLERDEHGFDAAVLDYNIPDMNVVDLAGHVRARHQPLPLVLFSSTTVPLNVSTAFAATLRKPATSQSLVTALRSALNYYTAPTTGAAASPVRGLRVLIAEDVAINQDMMIKFVAHLGHHADLVANGADAVAAVRRGHYDVVLMDAQMPVMDGVEATRIIRALPVAQPRIVAVTAGAFADDQDRFLAAGADRFCTKPIRLNELAQAISPPGQGGATFVPPAAPPSATPGDRHEHQAQAEDVLDSHTIENLYQLGPVADQLVSKFLASLLPEVDKITTDAATGKSIRRLAHMLTGSSGFFGATHVARISASLQDDTHTPERRAELLTQLQHEAYRANTALRALLDH